MANVYITHAPRNDKGFDFSPATQYGKLRVVFDGNPSLVNEYVLLMKARLAEFEPKTDFLLLSGDPIVIGIITALVWENTCGELSFLKWDKIQKSYWPVKITSARKENSWKNGNQS